MARTLNRLSARAVATAKPGKYPDGGGLWLQVTPSGAKSWVFRYERKGIERFMGLGPTHAVTLARARDDAAAVRLQLRNGIDPLEHRQAARSARAGIPTFRQAAEAYIQEQRPGWRNPKHADQWTNTLEVYAMPALGGMQVDAITTDDVLDVLRPIWTTKTETASRVRQRIEAVLDTATARRQREGENPARWRGHLAKLLPKPSKVRAVEHFAALPYADAPGFMAQLRAQEGTAARALEFLILTAARTGMLTGSKAVAGMTWDELEASEWHVPAVRMKSKRAFTVPLSEAARALLDGLPKVPEAGVFPGARKPHLSTGAMDALLARMGFDGITVHGFRSTFRDWASETTAFASEVVEMALAHTIKDKTEAAYRRGALLAKRRELMEAWAAFLLPT